jgi:branched-chain amino acid transport system permease protein
MSLVTGVRRGAAKQPEAIALGLLFAASLALPGAGYHPLGVGVYGQGAVFGAALALQAMGLVLIYRSTRIVNFAQVYLGAVSAAVFIVLVNERLMLTGLNSVCGCLSTQRRHVFNSDRTYTLPAHIAGWLWQLNFWLSFVVAIGVGIAVSWLVHRAIVRRFEDRSPLMLTVVTVAIAQFLSWLVSFIITRYSGRSELNQTIHLPIPVHLTLSPARFDASDMAMLLVAICALIATTAFLRRSTMGELMRGLADNPMRARTLGVDTSRVRNRSWVLAGLFSSLAAVLGTTSTTSANLADPQLLVRLLAVLVLARQESLLLAVVAAVALEMFDSAVLFTSGNNALVDVILFLVIAAVLLVQRARRARVDTELLAVSDFGVEVRRTPAVLRRVPAVRNARITIIAALGVLVGVAPLLLSDSQQRLAISAVVSGMIALSLLVLTGWSGQISLGQLGFAAVGGYVVGLVHLPFPVPLLLGGLVGAACAILVGLPALRLSGLTLAITTLAFGQAIASYLLSPEHLGKHLPTTISRPFVLGIDLQSSRSYYYCCLIVLGLTIVAVRGLRSSRTARVLIAARDNDALAQAYGISLVRARLSAFALSGFIAAVAGGLMALDFGDVQPATFGANASINAFLVVVVGGLGGVSPPLVGAAFFGLLAIFSGNPLVTVFFAAGGTLTTMMFLPGGVGAGLFRLRDAFLRRVADRNRIQVPSLTADRQLTAATRAPIAPVQRGAGRTYLPVRYRLDAQWNRGLRGARGR